MGTPIQKILFGSPGIGKSYQVRQIATEELGIELDPTTRTSPNIIKTVFHPEYTYGDFMGKLLPHGQGNSVTYKYYPGHFLRALGKAYRSILDYVDLERFKNESIPLPKCLLVIDELNRGNSSAIFGTVFQLLDREDDGWSSYEIDLSDLEMIGLFNSMNYRANVTPYDVLQVDDTSFDKFCNDLERYLRERSNTDGLRLLNLLRQHKISLPSNLSIVGTINTSDESIYYLDSAFKRRWDWEYIAAPHDPRDAPSELLDLKLTLSDDNKVLWTECIVALNNFIKSQHQSIRRLEDKQIGWWFIKPVDGQITLQQVKNKLLFYLWDTIFVRDRRPLEKVLSEASGKDIKLITFDDFTSQAEPFINHILEMNPFPPF